MVCTLAVPVCVLLSLIRACLFASIVTILSVNSPRFVYQITCTPETGEPGPLRAVKVYSTLSKPLASAWFRSDSSESFHSPSQKFSTELCNRLSPVLASTVARPVSALVSVAVLVLSGPVDVEELLSFPELVNHRTFFPTTAWLRESVIFIMTPIASFRLLPLQSY